jgi:hypothetical protein
MRISMRIDKQLLAASVVLDNEGRLMLLKPRIFVLECLLNTFAGRNFRDNLIIRALVFNNLRHAFLGIHSID